MGLATSFWTMSMVMSKFACRYLRRRGQNAQERQGTRPAARQLPERGSRRLRSLSDRILIQSGQKAFSPHWIPTRRYMLHGRAAPD